LQERAPRRAHQDHLHLVGDRVQRAPDDFERDRIHVYTSTVRRPAESRLAFSPTPTSVVVPSSSTSAGPVISCPGIRSERKNTGTSIQPPSRKARRASIGRPSVDATAGLSEMGGVETSAVSRRFTSSMVSPAV